LVEGPRQLAQFVLATGGIVDSRTCNWSARQALACSRS
jgi:hypothetical protein